MNISDLHDRYSAVLKALQDLAEAHATNRPDEEKRLRLETAQTILRGIATTTETP